MDVQPAETVLKMDGQAEQLQDEEQPAVPSDSDRHSAVSSASTGSSKSSRSSKSSDSVGGLRKRRPNQYIPLGYQDLVRQLGAMVENQKPAKWQARWQMLFEVILPLYSNLKTAEIFKPLIEQYDLLDPTPRTVTRPAPPKATDDTETTGNRVESEFSHENAVDAISQVQQPLCISRDTPERGARTTHALPRGFGGTASAFRGFGGAGSPPAEGSAVGFREGSLSELMQTCGFQEVPSEFIREAEEEEGRQGLNVHVPSAAELPTQVYYRGLTEKQEERRAWQTCFLRRREVVKVFLNLVFVYSYTYQPEDAPENLCSRMCWLACNSARRRAVGPRGSEGKVFMHAYNAIALPDMDMLWPASSPNPTLFDIVSIGVPLLVALGSSIWKIIGVMTDIDDLTDIGNLMVILFTIVAPFSIAFRYFMKAKNKYYLYKARHADTLIEHTHSTNRGTLSSLLEDATVQESKEFVVAYTLLSIAPQPLTVDELRAAANSVLQRTSGSSPQVGYDLDFDVVDAVGDLDRLGLLVRHPEGGLGVQGLARLKRAISLARFEHRLERKMKGLGLSRQA